MGITQDSSSFEDSIIDLYTGTLEIVDLRIRILIPIIPFKALSIIPTYSNEDTLVELGLDDNACLAAQLHTLPHLCATHLFTNNIIGHFKRPPQDPGKTMTADFSVDWSLLVL